MTHVSPIDYDERVYAGTSRVTDGLYLAFFKLSLGPYVIVNVLPLGVPPCYIHAHHFCLGTDLLMHQCDHVHCLPTRSESEACLTLYLPIHD